MPDEPKDLRIPIYMSGREVESIDKWRFENHIATRAQAVRRLVQMGLGVDDQSEFFMLNSLSMTDALKELTEKLDPLIPHLKADPDKGEEYIYLVYKAYEDSIEKALKTRDALLMMHASKWPGRGLLSYDKLKAALRKHEEQKSGEPLNSEPSRTDE